MKKLMLLTAMMLFVWSMNSAYAQKPGVVLDNDPGWQKIGETVASFKSQDESIAVLGADEFAAIKLRVEGAPLEIDRLQVFYESGDMEEIAVQKRIQSGNESTVFRLKHPDRDIQKVAFTYNTAPNAEGEKAEVELYGLKTGSEGESKAYRDEAERAEDAAEDIEDEADETERRLERKADRAEDDIDQSAERTETDLERAADKTGDAISETAAKAAAEIDDPRHDTKVGPEGQVIFIADDSRFYYVNEKGKRVYISEARLKDKPEKD